LERYDAIADRVCNGAIRWNCSLVPAMTREDYDAFCKSLLHATHVVQWGDASVWKIGGKVFAIGGWSRAENFAVSFKCSQTSFAILSELPGLRPAPYLASRGFLWMQRVDDGALDDAGLQAYLKQSYALVAAGLPKRAQRALGLTDKTGHP
jgi:predicted DNA-binding protein (MmcQ/YjbR family)